MRHRHYFLHEIEGFDGSDLVILFLVVFVLYTLLSGALKRDKR